MLKKKATMTLKDFHGGSIPSDLPLPSAPGFMARPSDRGGGYDRQTLWGNPMGRGDHHLRPGSAGMTRNFDDKTPFSSHTTQIGRNFDEDERKPSDGASGPRRSVSDDSLRVLPTHPVEPKMDHSATGRGTARPASTSGSQYSSGTGYGSHAWRSTEVNDVAMSSHGFGGGSGVGLRSQKIGGPNGEVASSTHPNAWGLRKEPESLKEPGPAPWSAPDAATKLANASALEKVSSGRWHSRQQISPQTDVEVIKNLEVTRKLSETYSREGDNRDNSGEVVGEMDLFDLTLTKQLETSFILEDVPRGVGRDTSIYGRARPPTYMEANERNHSDSNNDFQQTHSVGKLVRSEMQSTTPSELSERPKLKLLPRSKPLENPEPPMDYNQGLQQPNPVHTEKYSESHITNLQKGGFLGSEGGNGVFGRTKLNLKPRSAPVEQLDGDAESKRNTLFGGARPRELVLKDRGIDNTAFNNDNLVQAQQRNKQDAIKTENAQPSPLRYSDKPENVPIERMGKNPDRRDERLDVEKADSQRRNWRNENRRNKRESEKHPHPQQQQQQQQQLQQQQEWPPSPETWRKPVQHPNSAALDTPGQRYGKTASAVELAQAFSRSISDPAIPDHFSGQRGIPSRGQIPFSRLMSPGTTPKPQINGY